MRWMLILLMVAVLLAACAGPVGPTASPVMPDVTAKADGTPTLDPAIQIVTRPAPTEDFELAVPLPGEWVASATEDPDIALIFDQITLRRSHGPAGSPTIEIELLQDGTYTADGTEGVLSADRVLVIDTMLDELNFFGMQGAMIGPGLGEDDYRYTLTVMRADLERTIQSQDNFMPREYVSLLVEIMRLSPNFGR